MQIRLHSPSLRNDGSFVDAGVDIVVGDEAGEISLDRATDLVGADRAVEIKPAQPDE